MAPENTLPAFALAIEHGADGVEFDVQLSSDGQVIVIHDETLERTTTGSGWVKDHTAAELSAMDASGGRPDFPEARIPSLDEVLALLAPTRLRLNIELKNSEVAYPGLEQQVIDAVAAVGMAERVVYSSFSQESVRLLGRLLPAAQVGLIYSRPFGRPLRTAASLGAGAVHPDRRLLGTAQWVERAHRRGLAVRPWVANSPRAIQRMFAMGVDAFFTDAPQLACALRDQAIASASL